MSLINVSLNLVAYADAMKNVNPAVKFSDLKWSLLGLPTANPQMIPINLMPGETKTVMSASRAISYSGATSFQILPVVGTSNSRLVGAYGARTGRSSGDGTTQWAVTRTNNFVQFLWTGTGTAPTFSGILPGDGITITSPFNTFNQGDFVVTNKGSNFVEFINPIGVNETVIGQVDIYSNSPVQVGDILDVSAGAFSFPNQGQFPITRVTDLYVEFSNPNAIPETVSGITSGVTIYQFASKWMLMAIDHRVVIQFNGDSGTGVECEPPADGDIINNPGLLLKRGKIFQLVVTNPGQALTQGFIFLSE